MLLVVHLLSRNRHQTQQYMRDETVGVSREKVSVGVASVEINSCHLVLMEIIQSILCLGPCPPRDDITPAGMIVMSWGYLYVTGGVFDVKPKSETDQDSLHSQRHESRYCW